MARVDLLDAVLQVCCKCVKQGTVYLERNSTKVSTPTQPSIKSLDRTTHYSYLHIYDDVVSNDCSLLKLEDHDFIIGHWSLVSSKSGLLIVLPRTAQDDVSAVLYRQGLKLDVTMSHFLKFAIHNKKREILFDDKS